MNEQAPSGGPPLPEPAASVLAGFTEAAREAFGPDLRSVVLYGSAAEGRLRPTSDLNVLVVLAAFRIEAAARIEEPLRAAATAAGLSAMFLLEDEVGPASEAFASKFADMLRRRRVLYGTDPLAGVVVPRGAMRARLRQELLNLAIRWRAAFASAAGREEALAFSLAESAGPLRAAAAAILELAGRSAPDPKGALEALARELRGEAALAHLRAMTEARGGSTLPPGAAGGALLFLADLARALRARVEALE
jgi:predicted nucleotidyltransferase